MNILLYLKYYFPSIVTELLNHIKIIGLSLPLSIFISVPIGFLISQKPKIAKIVIYIASILMTIPSLALFGIMVVILAPLKIGLGISSAVIAITIYSLLPIIRNTYTALNQVSPDMIQAAKGIGLTSLQILLKIKLPLSIPVIMAGIRNAMVMGVSIATYATLVGAGGLGFFIFSGIDRSNIYMIVTGTLLVSISGIIVNFLMLKLEEKLIPKGLKINRE